MFFWAKYTSPWYSANPAITFNNVLLPAPVKPRITISSPTNFRGIYEFEEVELNEACIDYGINDRLIATIEVEYTPEGEEMISNSFTGNTQINTLLPELQCVITYDMISSSYSAESGEENYNITVEIINGLDLEKIEYTCGIDDLEESDLDTEEEQFNFNCDYIFELGYEDEIYIVKAEITDKMGDRTAICQENVGLCLPYV